MKTGCQATRVDFSFGQLIFSWDGIRHLSIVMALGSRFNR
jgi:hypothetical protein